MPNVKLDDNTVDDLFDLKKAYTAQTGEEASFDDVISAAVRSLEEETDFSLARRVKEDNQGKDNDDMDMSMSL